MEKSILDTIKAMLGLADTYEAFDNELVSHINSALFIVGQLGIGPSDSFILTALQNQAQELAWRTNAQVDNLPPAIAIDEE